MADQVYLIESGVPIHKPVNRGRPFGSGSNSKMLHKMKPGDSVSMVPEGKMRSIKVTAFRNKIKICVRKIPDTKYYIIWRL